VFDAAARLLLVCVEDGLEVSRCELMVREERWDSIAIHLTKLGVTTLICGAISQPLACMLDHLGIEVIADVCGEVDQIVHAFIEGNLGHPRFLLPGCRKARTLTRK
jgi:predicted Fe-Mo cluster-binding NifX family protein